MLEANLSKSDLLLLANKCQIPVHHDADPGIIARKIWKAWDSDSKEECVSTAYYEIVNFKITPENVKVGDVGTIYHSNGDKSPVTVVNVYKNKKRITIQHWLLTDTDREKWLDDTKKHDFVGSEITYGWIPSINKWVELNEITNFSPLYGSYLELGHAKYCIRKF